MSILRERLRSETMDLHRQTEERSALIPLFKSGEWNNEVEEKYKLNLLDQRDLIEFLMKHQTEWEQIIPSALSLKAALEAVKIELGLDSEKPSLKVFSASPEETIGVAYVMLGSSMGSQVILNKLGDKIPVRYHAFLKTMAAISVNFRTFCTEIENDLVDDEASIEGAKRAFIYMATPNGSQVN